MTRPYLNVTWAILLLPACSGSGPDRTLHPTADNLHPPGAIIPVPAGLAGSDSSPVANLARELARLRSDILAGRLNGGPAETFGGIAGVAMMEDGRVLVLDNRDNNVRVLSADGKQLFAAGRAGAGPGELQAPQAIGLLSDGMVAIADRHRIVKLMTLRGDSLNERSVVRLDLVPESMCTLGDRIVVEGYAKTERILHEFDPTGREIREFGSPYLSPSAFTRSQLSDGSIACLRAVGQIAFAFESMPIVRIFSTSDTAVSRTFELTRFKPMQIIEGEDQGRPSLTYSAETAYDWIEGMGVVRGRFVVVQVGHYTPESLKDSKSYAYLATYLLDPATGHGVHVSDSLPRISGELGLGLLGFSNDPYPRVVVAR